MTGFLKRDLYLSVPFLRMYGIFLAVSLFLTTRSDKLGQMYLLYLTVLGTVGVQNLFTFDEVNGWRSYAAAVPGGRRSMVDAHYLLALGLGGILALAELFVGWRLEGEGLFYTGLFLLLLALLLPAACRFGSRLVSAVYLLVLGAAVVGVIFFLAWWDLMLGWNMDGTLAALSGALPLVGLVLFLLSWPLSRLIMKKKEC